MYFLNKISLVIGLLFLMLFYQNCNEFVSKQNGSAQDFATSTIPTESENPMAPDLNNQEQVDSTAPKAPGAVTVPEVLGLKLVNAENSNEFISLKNNIEIDVNKLNGKNYYVSATVNSITKKVSFDINGLFKNEETTVPYTSKVIQPKSTENYNLVVYAYEDFEGNGQKSVPLLMNFSFIGSKKTDEPTTEILPDSKNIMIGSALAVASLNPTNVDPLGIMTHGEEKCSIRFIADSDTLESVVNYHQYSATRKGYSNGDGGTVKYHILNDDGSKNSLPTGKPIASTNDIIAGPLLFKSLSDAQKKYPKAVLTHYGETGSRLAFRRINLLKPAKLTPGKTYHMVIENTSPDKRNLISINHIRGDGPQRRMFYRDNDPNFKLPGKNFGVVRFKNNKWTEAAWKQMGIFELYYKDGTIGGQTYIATQNVNDGDNDRTQAFSGKKMVRQTWMPKYNVTLNEFGVFLTRQKGSKNVTLTISQGNQNLFSGELSASQYPIGPNSPSTDIKVIGNNGRWGQIKLPGVKIKKGEMVYLNLKTDSSTEYEVSSPRDGTTGYFKGNQYSFKQGAAQVSNDGGSKWSDFLKSSAYDLSFFVNATLD